VGHKISTRVSDKVVMWPI